MKNISVIAYHTCPLSDEDVTQTGGLNIYVLELCKALSKKGLRIDIFTRSVSKESKKIVQINQFLRVIHLVAGKEKEIEKKRLFRYLPEFINNYFTFLDQFKLKYDLIYCHYYLSALAGWEIKEKKGIPLIINFHTLALMKNLVARSDQEKEEEKRIVAEKMLLEKGDKIIATSKVDALYLSSLYDYPLNKISVLTPGVDLSLFTPREKETSKKEINIREAGKVILFVGRIEPLKGIDVLLYAIKILERKKQKLKLSLVVVGSGKTELRRLKQLINVLNIKTRVHFVGKKSQNELPAYYNASDIVVMPSQYESFGIVALEAMACGTPVITTDVTGISSLFDDYHPLITSAGNPILLSEKIENLLQDSKKYEEARKEVLEKAKNLSWDKVAREFELILQNIAKTSA